MAMTMESMIETTGKYENLGGIYFPILQQDGTRTMVKIGNGKDKSQVIFLGWLRQHDRMPGKVLA
jgi:hypothetical protein